MRIEPGRAAVRRGAVLGGARRTRQGIATGLLHVLDEARGGFRTDQPRDRLCGLLRAGAGVLHAAWLRALRGSATRATGATYDGGGGGAIFARGGRPAIVDSVVD